MRPRLFAQRTDDTWTYALLGGLASVPLTVSLYVLSDAGSEISLNAVVLGGFLAGYLVRSASADADPGPVGVRAGVVGGVPTVVWGLSEVAGSAAAVAGPVPFRVAAVGMVLFTITTVVLTFAGLGGYVGARVGGWLAGRIDSRRPRVEH
jgi:hypothetical protein